MFTFAEKYAQLDSDILGLILVAAFYIVLTVAKGAKKSKKNAVPASPKPRRAAATRTVRPAVPPAAPAAAKATPEPFLTGNDGFGPDCTAAAATVAQPPEPPRRKRRPALPGGTDPRAAVIWGEVLRRKF